MCGIFGWSIPLDVLGPEERAVLATFLSRENDDRGGDSWGAYFVNGQVGIQKGLGRSFGRAPWIEIARDAHVLMAHTRKATHGAISIENAHPFEVGNIVGAHNGWISNHSELNTKYKRNFDVDSLHIFAHLQKGWKLSELTGYGAIEYTNRKKTPERVNLCKLTSASDLAIYSLGKDKTDYNGVIWSSAKRAVELALDAAGLMGRYFEWQVTTGEVYVAERGQLILKKSRQFLSPTALGECYSGRGCSTGYGGTAYTPPRDRWNGDIDTLDSNRYALDGRLLLWEENCKIYLEKAALESAFKFGASSASASSDAGAVSDGEAMQMAADMAAAEEKTAEENLQAIDELTREQHDANEAILNSLEVEDATDRAN